MDSNEFQNYLNGLTPATSYMDAASKCLEAYKKGIFEVGRGSVFTKIIGSAYRDFLPRMHERFGLTYPEGYVPEDSQASLNLGNREVAFHNNGVDYRVRQQILKKYGNSPGLFPYLEVYKGLKYSPDESFVRGFLIWENGKEMLTTSVTYSRYMREINTHPNTFFRGMKNFFTELNI